MARGVKTMCRAVERDLDALLDGQLRSERRAAVLRHSESCEACARAVSLARAARQRLLATPRAAAPEAIRAAVHAAVAPDALAVGVLRALPTVAPPPTLAPGIHRAVATQAAVRQAALCARFAREVDRLVRGELGEGEALAFERHAAACAACDLLLERARAAASVLRDLPRLPPVPAALVGTRAALACEHERRAASARRAPVWAVAAAAAACLVFLGLMYGPSLIAPGPLGRTTGPMVAGNPEAPAEPAGLASGGNAPAERVVTDTAPPEPASGANPVGTPVTRRAPTRHYVRSGPGPATSVSREPVAPKPDGPPDGFAPDRGHPIVVVASAPPSGLAGPRPASDQVAGATSVGRSDRATLTL